MRLKTLYVRFFRSFNYDYVRKSDPGSVPDPWDVTPADSLFYPFVRIPIEEGITTVVGANEAGKSQLLRAVQCLLTGANFEQRDFCRYSDFFAVDREMALPEFGGEFNMLTDSEMQNVRKALGLDSDAPVESFWLFRFEARVSLYVRAQSGEVTGKTPTKAQLDKIILPTYFEIDAHTPLPDSVPIDFLADGKVPAVAPRKSVLEWADRMLQGSPIFKKEKGTAGADTQSLLDQHPYLVKLPASEVAQLSDQMELARKLLIDVAGLNPSAFKELRKAIRVSEGYANAIIDKLNATLDASLNFSKWWSQDRDFKLALTRGDRDILFTIRDRTGSDYAFSERSGGMSYFLSYFVQWRSHVADSDFEILLMDEPDAYLSMLGQQDLLNIFDDFARPTDTDRNPVQVLYVTHSPFMIDKNHGERIRVLEKGDGDEGTRVVSNAARNHYEPLRSSLGAFVAETTFIGNCNLMVEGQGDQVLLAGVSSFSRRLDRKQIVLNLNTISIVPCGGAKHVPYMVYLARGRDVDVPALIVLLDSDDEGTAAAAEIKAGFGGRTIVHSDYVISIGDLDSTLLDVNVSKVQEIEDLIPAEVARRALLHFAKEVLSGTDAMAFASSLGAISPSNGQKLFKAVEAAAKAASPTLERPLQVSKVGFARGVLHVLAEVADEQGVAARDRTLRNFDILFVALDKAQRDALRDNDRERVSKVVNRLRRNFLKNHPKVATGRDILDLLETIEHELPPVTPEAEQLRDSFRRMRAERKLEHEPMAELDDYEDVKRDLESLAYDAVRKVQDR